MQIQTLKNRKRIPEIVDIHMETFTGFFLTFLGKGFLGELYKGYIEHEGSGILVAVDNKNRIIGFLAYSSDISAFYKFLIKRHLLVFVWYAGLGFLRKPRVFFRLLRAFTYSRETKRDEKYIELSSIGVSPSNKNHGVGSKLIDSLKERTDFRKYDYIKLETDAINNEGANYFYQKNGFVLDHAYETHEGRKMNEYRWYL